MIGWPRRFELDQALQVLEQQQMLVGQRHAELLIRDIEPAIVLGQLQHQPAELADLGDGFLARLGLFDLFLSLNVDQREQQTSRRY